MCRPTVPVSGGVVAEVREEVIVELPEDVESDPAVGRGHSLVHLLEHGIPRVQLHVLRQQPMSQLVDLQQQLQFLAKQMQTLTLHPKALFRVAAIFLNSPGFVLWR